MLSAEDRSRLLRQVTRVSSCRHPIRLIGQSTNLVTGEWTERELRLACKDRRFAVCPACSERYETDAWIIMATGVNGGKGVPETVARAPRLFVTVTAPSFGAVHRANSSGQCVARSPRQGVRCPHYRATWCDESHDEHGVDVGRPLCIECADLEGAVEWNAHASVLFSEMIRRARQNVITAMGLSRRRAGSRVRLEYAKVAELQRRGLVHFHAIVRLDLPGDVAAPEVLFLAHALRSAVRSTSVRDQERDFRFGSVVDVQPLGESARDVAHAASYLAKYVTKTASGNLELARRFSRRSQIARAVADPYRCRLVECAWDLGYERHANTVGYRGQFLTKSRGYSTTFANLRAARVAFWNPAGDADPVRTLYRFDGRGYDDPRAAELAEILAQLDRERRREERRLVKEKDVDL